MKVMPFIITLTQKKIAHTKGMLELKLGLVGWFMVLIANFNNISVLSWRSVLLVQETGLPGENHRPIASH
jgi:hypothetical protein